MSNNVVPFQINKVNIEKYGKEFKENKEKLQALKLVYKKLNDNGLVILNKDVLYDYETGLLIPQINMHNLPYIPTSQMKIRSSVAGSSLLKFGEFDGRLPYKMEIKIFEKLYGIYRDADNDFIANLKTISDCSERLFSNRKVKRICVQESIQPDNKVQSGYYKVYSVENKKITQCKKDYMLAVIPVFQIFEPLEKISLENTIDIVKAFSKYGLYIDQLANECKLVLNIDKKNIDDLNLNKKEYIEKKLRESIGEKSNSGSFDDKILQYVLEYDTRRANITPYPMRILTDINAGSWDLYENDRMKEEAGTKDVVELSKSVTARPPELDIKASGTCAIDFGTKSTVVVCRNQEERLLRIGKGDFTKAPVQRDYENPTAIELRDIEGFCTAYNAQLGRPETLWEQITVSHQAADSFTDSEQIGGYQSVFSDMKQWANNGKGNRRLQDLKGKEIILPKYLACDEETIDPIELYAYYLGLYINNMANGIYLDYIISYPVNYEKDVREKLRQSFENGIRKSLPTSILENEELMEDFRVYLGASEPAAYASCALKEMGRSNEELRPAKDRPIFYAVFDFGGGTTDFDYGIWRLPTPEDKGRWNYVIEHFDAEGDVNLGGEKLLNILAYEVYKANLEEMRSKNVSMLLPAECKAFSGSELLLNESDGAHLNMRKLSEALRSVWEQTSDKEKFNKDALEIKLFAGNKLESFKLKVDVNALEETIKARIKFAVDNFFLRALHAFDGKLPDKIHILLAGNSCKSKFVQDLFAERIAEEAKNIHETAKAAGREVDASGFYELHLPIGISDKEKTDYDRMPTGKTGVAFGLLDCRKGGRDVKVINHNLSADKEASFQYYLGAVGDHDNFEVLISREVPYNTWISFYEIYDDNRFEIYYSSKAISQDNELSINDVPAPKRCRIHYLSEDEEGGMIYIRKVGPKKIEYTVASEADFDGTNMLARVETCEFD